MHQTLHTLSIDTAGPGLIDITDRVARWVRDQPIPDGLLTLFCRHTSASLLIQENAASAVKRDIVAYFAKLAPESDVYEHDDEGPDDMPAHLRAALTGIHLSIPVASGSMLLGRWQGIYLFEHRRWPHRRDIVLHLLG